MVSRDVTLKVGDRVTIPWGLEEELTGRVVEVWGDPPAHVRVELDLGEDESEVLLLSPDVIKRVA